MSILATTPNQTSDTVKALDRAAVDRLSDRPFQVVTHAHMLRDAARLSSFRAAIDALVTTDSVVVDVGTGTGILAAYAATRSKQKIYAIEVERSSAVIARHLMSVAGLAHVEVIEGTSFGRPIQAAPSVLITETLGPLGVDEHIVEICREFCLQYPSITTLVPHTLRLCCVPISSRSLRVLADQAVADIVSAGFDAFRYEAVENELRHALARQVFDHACDDATLVGPCQTLASYALGLATSSRFSTRVAVPPASDAMHFYFEAELGADQLISTAVFRDLTHWGRHFVIRPPNARELRVSYTPGTQQLGCEWTC